MVDLPVWDLGWLLQCNVNNPEFRDRDRAMTVALVKFLQEHGLLKTHFLEDGEAAPNDLLIKESDLTKEGLAFQNSMAIDRWLRANDDIRKPLSIRSLERGLKAIRSS